jgi:hypothetical protein
VSGFGERRGKLLDTIRFVFATPVFTPPTPLRRWCAGQIPLMTRCLRRHYGVHTYVGCSPPLPSSFQVVCIHTQSSLPTPSSLFSGGVRRESGI